MSGGVGVGWGVGRGCLGLGAWGGGELGESAPGPVRFALGFDSSDFDRRVGCLYGSGGQASGEGRTGKEKGQR